MSFILSTSRLNCASYDVKIKLFLNILAFSSQERMWLGTTSKMEKEIQPSLSFCSDDKSFNWLWLFCGLLRDKQLILHSPLSSHQKVNNSPLLPIWHLSGWLPVSENLCKFTTHPLSHPCISESFYVTINSQVKFLYLRCTFEQFCAEMSSVL